MLCVCGVTVFLLLVGGEAQSGDSDSEPGLSCFSHIMMDSCSLTCRLEGRGGNSEDDEDEETDSIQKITMCYRDWGQKAERCIETLGDTVSSTKLNPLGDYNVTVYLKRGRRITTTVELKKIVKPRSPQVSSVTFDLDSYQAVFHIQTLHPREYLKVENQMFQLLIWSAGSSLTQNVSSSDTLKVNMQHLTLNTQYHVRVRAIPLGHLQGTWSEWSDSSPFFTPDEPGLSCFSHIMMDSCSLTCRLEGRGGNSEDDEDEETDSIQKITMCYRDWGQKAERCIEGLGDTVSSTQLNPLGDYNVTVYLKRGRRITTTVELKKIVKPRSPQVSSVTFDLDSYQAVFHIQTPYHQQYLKVENQMFQLLIWSAGSSLTQNVSSSDTLKVNMQHLTLNTQYHVRVRAIPLGHLQGTWSEWSDSSPFFTPDEPGLSCFSHIMMDSCSLTCRLEGRGGNSEDDEDEETDSIQKITMCYRDWGQKAERCIEGLGDTVSSTQLNPLGDYNVTVYLKRGRRITTTVELKKIVKPRSPQVSSVTFDLDSYQAVFHIQTPYHQQYLKVENQMFQLLIWSAGSSLTQNVSSSDTLKVNMQHLTLNTQYHVRVRAIPLGHLQGTWSEWSDSSPFFTPDVVLEQRVHKQTDVSTLRLTVCLVVLLLVTSCVVFFWKIKIFSYMWPSIPHPKHTLVQICRPNKGLLLNFKPEEFSALRVSPLAKSEEQPCEETDPLTPPAANSSSSTPPCSTQTSECSTTITSISTEELSGLLSRSSSDVEDGVQSSGPSSINFLQDEQRPHTPPQEHSEGGNEGEESGGSQQEEAYVTMSSFYQIK
uniref:Fibronectin type-III domain-containing protein n=1 Tax=Labrus bergylta TaxID=56723 RepID=A0A3Q3G062_9LABR